MLRTVNPAEPALTSRSRKVRLNWLKNRRLTTNFQPI